MTKSLSAKLARLAANNIAIGPAMPIRIAPMAPQPDPHQPIPSEVRREAIRNEREKREGLKREQRALDGERVGRAGEDEVSIRNRLGLEHRTEPGHTLYPPSAETESVRQARSGDILRNLGLGEEQPEPGAVTMAMTKLLAADLIEHPSAERENIYRNLGLLPV
jgi:hypothetical protein